MTKNATIVLNYLKKHNCHIKAYWSYGIRYFKVVKGEKELSYPRINEDTWCEISRSLEGIGDYQKTMTYNLTTPSEAIEAGR